MPSDRIAWHGLPSGLALQKAQISNHCLTIFLAHAGKTRHSVFRNPVVNQLEQRLIRESLHCGPADDIGRMLTAEAVKSMASRAFQLENVLSPESGFSGTSLDSSLFEFWQRTLPAAPNKISTNPNVENDSPGHIALRKSQRSAS